MTKLKVNVVIAGRTYPLSVGSIDEEEGMRKAARNINELIAKFEQNYAVADKQDVLAMCALQFASKLEIESISKEKKDKEALQKIKGLIKLIDAEI
ncbi:cell division protein ZapA [Tenacibaculum sp. MAR_2009_124]|uniref:cell division protein ZapA n=1 Tax=Tenacibaculum sp. MAR_2009_124 TaxID=1250059 RepID=UPI0008947C5F|nr:cell division protein ZapA [Tenacibaculum sp. MAR_2009_124]SEB37028.1 cell division protein ZapA [Tenacibaculum sp. MAR_2009_124]